MSNPSKAKGSRWETAVAKYLRDHGWPEAFRLAPAGDADCGDIGGVSGWAFECRDRAKHDLSKNVKDANQRAINKSALYGCAVMKKREHPTEDGYVVMDLATFVRVLNELAGITD